MKVVLYVYTEPQVRQVASFSRNWSIASRRHRCSPHSRKGAKGQERHRSPGRPQRSGKDRQRRQDWGRRHLCLWAATSHAIGLMDRLVKAIQEARGPRLIVVGGAGSLFVAPGVTLRASGRLPKGMDPHPSCANSRRSRRIVSSERSNSWLTDLATTCPSARSLSTFGQNSPLATGIPATPATQMRPELHLRPMPAARLANADVTVSERFGHSRELP